MNKREGEIFLLLIVVAYLVVLVIIAAGAMMIMAVKLFIESAAARPVMVSILIGVITLFFAAKRIAKRQTR